MLRLLLAKNPAGWSELMPLLAQAPAVLLVINAQEADGRDTSWLWDVPFEQLAVPCVVASGERAADVGLRLSYAGIEHVTEPDPLTALERMPSGEVQVVANYTAFLGLRRRLGTEVTS
jgi:UDP-N-acetylmuramyl tripeptide synthase